MTTLSGDIEQVVIVGGGTAGWMAATALSKFLNDGKRRFTLVESDEIGIVGVGEATIPPIQNFNRMLDIAENDFLRATQGTFKLGIEFVNWGKPGDRYIHPFGSYGHDLHGIDFHQLYLREAKRGNPGPIGDYSMCVAAARAGRFGRPQPNVPSPVGQLNYAFHFDAALYARFLRGRAEKQGVVRREGRITRVLRDGESGFVTGLELADGSMVEGEFFLDCSGFHGLLIEQELQAGYEDWSHWLPVDRAIAVPTANEGSPAPYTRSTALEAGWQWKIPLQHRTGNGHVYCSRYLDDDAAEERLLGNLDAPVLAPPRRLRFLTGRRKSSWSHNVVALGLASGFIEPLESTAIHLIQNGIQRLLGLFPDRSHAAREREEYNRGMQAVYEDVRDFVILHYKATQRDDTPFWRYVRDMAVPDALEQKIALWRERAMVFREGAELFATPSWVAVMLGQNIWPRHYHPMVDSLDEERVAQAMQQMRKGYADTAAALPTQEQFLRMAGAWAAEDERPAQPIGAAR